MKIKVDFEGDDLGTIIREMIKFVLDAEGGAPAMRVALKLKEMRDTPKPEPQLEPDRAAATEKAISDVLAAREAPKKEAKPAPKAAKAKALGEPVTGPTPEPEVIDDDEADAEALGLALNPAVELQKVKDAQLDRLKDLFVAGKHVFVRELLKKYGNGAKVFPEVEAAKFPAIKAEIDREMGVH